VDLERRDEYTIQPRRYREIYIHSKLMFVDDVYPTLGSANLNARSMVGDSEFNICTESYTFTQAARRRVWGNLAGSDLDGKSCSREETKETFEKWGKRMKDNKKNRKEGKPSVNDSFIHPFEDPRGAPIVRLV
jgi:phosphatidylserine/phosphatidylglycerophosphate/cardiolipin synthase-like enzyme